MAESLNKEYLELGDRSLTSKKTHKIENDTNFYSC